MTTAGESERSERIERSPRIDGRTARALRTREAVVDACISLVDEGDLKPTVPRIAERAGVSVRSVFQHFDDIDGLFGAVGDRVTERMAAFVLHADPLAPLGERLPDVVRQRSLLLEVITPIRRATLINAWDSPGVDARLRTGQAFLRGEVERAFGQELDAADAAGGREERGELLDALDVALSWPTWDQLRTLGGCDVDEARAVVQRLLRSLLAPYRHA
ncbi:MAG: TetR/AcrR family transcriptional regulator [Acidimicrobiales bacterium]